MFCLCIGYRYMRRNCISSFTRNDWTKKKRCIFLNRTLTSTFRSTIEFCCLVLLFFVFFQQPHTICSLFFWRVCWLPSFVCICGMCMYAGRSGLVNSNKKCISVAKSNTSQLMWRYCFFFFVHVRQVKEEVHIILHKFSRNFPLQLCMRLLFAHLYIGFLWTLFQRELCYFLFLYSS